MISQAAKNPTESPADQPVGRTGTIFWVSVLGLFLELLLIRWIGTEIRIFAYLQNTVLVVCFLGLGMGCFTSRRPVNIRRSLAALWCLTLVLAVPWLRSWAQDITVVFGRLNDLLIWHNAAAVGAFGTMAGVILGLLLTFGLMLLLWEVFVPLGRILGRAMDDHPQTVRAYSVNVAGSLIGIALFVLLSAAYMPPVVWFAVAGGLFLVLPGRGPRRLETGMIAAVVVTAWVAGREPGATEVVWSPYQKLVLTGYGERDSHTSYTWPGESLILVNNTGYQGMIDLSDEAVGANPGIPAERRGLSQYDIPLLFHPRPEQVLILGSGAGNDVAGALRGGAGHVTAVEIDPAIIELGRRHHPERPYDSPRVSVTVDDARSFFASTDRQFDLIIFGLLDSHTTTSMTNARLDHYVYTRESLMRARSLLAPGGVMVLSFETVKPYIGDRMAGCLREVFGSEPLTFRVPQDGLGWGGVMFITGDRDVIRQSLDEHPRLARQLAEWQETMPVPLTYATSIADDDWPYIYLETRRIPVLYYLLAIALLGLAAYCNRRLGLTGLVGGWNVSHWHFFFLGAAFLLLEVQNISKASVALGNTWIVSAVIISAILLMILLANLMEARGVRLPDGLTTVCLVGSCLGLYFVDLAWFASLPYAGRAIIVGALATVPMLFSGILFIRSFAVVARKDLALGANMYGALAGALLQSVTFITGIKALLLIVAGLYVAALLTRPRPGVATGEPTRPGGIDESTLADDRSPIRHEPPVEESAVLEAART